MKRLFEQIVFEFGPVMRRKETHLQNRGGSGDRDTL